jgi:uncharacterized protein with HEPN domain
VSRDVRLYLEDIIQSGARIQRYLAGMSKVPLLVERVRVMLDALSPAEGAPE